MCSNWNILSPRQVPAWPIASMAYSTFAKVWSSQRISNQSNAFSAEWKDNISILSKPDKAFPRERKWLCEYHSAWPSSGTLKYSSFWRWNSFQGHVTRHLDVAITLMMTMSSLSKILQSKNFSWEKLLTKSWNLQKKDVMDNAHSFSRKGSGFRIINTFHCLPSYS